MHKHGKCKILLSFDAEECGADSEMTTTADRQIFSKSLDDTKD